MANWNSKELQTPDAIKKIGQNAQNAINNLDILLKLVKQGSEVAKLFLLLSNPAGALIKLAADEIIKAANDYKEIGMFYLFINPNDPGYGNQTSRELGLAIKRDGLTGLYQFKSNVMGIGPGQTATFTVGKAYQRSLDKDDLDPFYRDSNNRTKADPKFIPPIPIYDDPPRWELGGIDPSTWNGHAPITSIPLADGTFPPEMKPSKVLQIMSESFDDRGDVSIFKIQDGKKNLARKAKAIYTASGEAINKNLFNPDVVQRERLFLDEIVGVDGTPQLMTERNDITDLVQSGKPNFAGSSNIQGVEVIAIVALVGVESYQKFVDAFKALKGLFGGMPSLTEFADDIASIYAKATAETGTPMTITNNIEFGDFKIGDHIVGQKSGAKAKILEIVKTEKLVMKKLVTRYQKVDTEASATWFPSINTDKTAGEEVIIFTDLVDDNDAGFFKKLDIKVKMLPEKIKFMPEETIFEGVEIDVGPPGREYKEVMIKAPSGSAINSTIPYNQVDKNDVASYGKVLGIDPTAPPSIHPDWTSIKMKDIIPYYGDFFDGIIQFAEGLKGYASGADEFIARIIKLIDDTIAEFEETVNTIKAFLQLFVDGLPAAGIYWLTIKTWGGNEAIQAALTGSDDPPPETLNFCAGFIMVSVSGMGGTSATAGLELLFGEKGFGLEFQEVAPIPEVTELDTAVLARQDSYQAARAAQVELATDVFDALGFNPPKLHRDATTITFTGWNGVTPNIGDYVLGTKSGAFGQILSFGEDQLVLDHIKIGPTIVVSSLPEERIVRMYDVTSATYIEFPYNGKVADASANGRAVSTETAATTLSPAVTNVGVTLVAEGRFAKEVPVNRSSHKPNGSGTTVYDVFQGNEGTFVRVDDTEELVSNAEFTLAASQSFNTFKQERTINQQVFKVVDGSVKTPVLESGFNGRSGYFTDDDTIMSFGEELAQTFLADIEGRNTEDDKVTRLKLPPTLDSKGTQPASSMSVVVAGAGQVNITGTGGIVESYAAALDNKLNPENQPLKRDLLND